MPNKTNLNVSPYYDDFDKDDSYYRVLFKPGYPVQARELTGLQSMLQNQVESFGQHIFKEGSMVIPGGVTCDNAYTSVKVNDNHLGIDVTLYLDALVSANDGKGAKVRGETSGVTGVVKGYLLPPEEGVEQITVFVKYRDGALDGESVTLIDGETLILNENVTYGNTTINAGDTILSLTASNSVKTGYAVNVAEGVYFVRGSFVDVQNSTIVLDPYDNNPSYRVGFNIIESIVNSDEDPSLNDNAKGFTNYAAPGADRLKISLNLTKKQLTDTEDTNFVELVKIDDGVIKKLQNKSDYSIIKDYFAKRTYEESGNYAVTPFTVDVVELLNDETGNGGLFRENELTEQGNVPTLDKMGVRISEGTAYIKGYDIDVLGSTVIDVDKPRSVLSKSRTANIPFAMGSLMRVNNVHGVPYINIGNSASGAQTTEANTIGLYSRRMGASTRNADTDLGTKIGAARVYSYAVRDAAYSGASTEFDLYMFDIQTYTNVTTGRTFSATEVPEGSYARGVSSGATGYVSEINGAVYSLSQTSGRFQTGEQIIFNGQIEYQAGISLVREFSVEDIKSVYQDSSSIGTGIQADFMADAVLYPRTPANFAKTDSLTITGGNAGKVGGRFFTAINGFREDAIIIYQAGNNDPQYNRITSVTGETQLNLAAVPANITGVCDASVDDGENYTFSLATAIIRDVGPAGLYAELPEPSIESVDVSNSSMIVTRQITGQTVANNGMTITTADSGVLGAGVGISSVFFTPFDAERYSIHYADGSTEPLTGDQFTIATGGGSISFTGLSKANESANVTVVATLKKGAITTKSKDFIKGQSLSIVRTTGVSNVAGLTTSKVYGTRIEDEEISLNVPDVVNVRAVYESTNTSAPVLDKLTFATGLQLDSNAIVGEKIVGEDSRAVAQVVSRTSNTISFVPLNQNSFQKEENVTFKESSLNLLVQDVTKGSYVDRTANYRLDKGHKHQFCDYSKIVRRAGSAVPSKQLYIVFDKFEVANNNAGDIFTVNSYSADRYTNDIPELPNGTRCGDVIDFRPRVATYDPASETRSPFSFKDRVYESTYRYVPTPNESSLFDYNFYLPRIDLVTLNRFGKAEVITGTPSEDPAPPILADDAMEIAQIRLPAYLYNTVRNPDILLRDNRRFTMRDIGKLEDRIDNLEEVTSLTMLELTAKTIAVTDQNGLDRFKSGFIVSDFRDKTLMDPRYSTLDIAKQSATAIAPVDFFSMAADLAYDPGIDRTTADPSQNLKLLDPNIQKTGDILTLKYEEVEFLNQPHATNVENVNPFNVIVFVGAVVLDPASDNWVRTIYINDHRTDSTGAKWTQQANTTINVDRKTEVRSYRKGGGRGERIKKNVTTTTTTATTKYTPKLEGPSREFDYVEDVKVSGEADPWMRSRNVYFAANGLRPYTKHYHYLDAQQVDVIPKLVEVDMQSGTFQIYEHADIIDPSGKKIGVMRIQKPNHKFGDTSRPDIGAGLGSPAVLVEEYTVDPYDRSRPAPGDSYSPTSKLVNFGVRWLADPKAPFYGYVTKGSRIIGKTSGAVATITNMDLISDNWGDLIANFFFRDPNANPKPPVRVKSGTKTVKITAVPPGVTPLPGSTVFGSEALGTYSGTGTIITQDTKRVSVRNPPKPQNRPTEQSVDVTVKASHRDPLAQSFTVSAESEGPGVFLTSFDLYFARKDPAAKVFVELRTVELGTPTSFLVQDFTQVALNPKDIVVPGQAPNEDDDPFEPLPTRIRFPSPVFLEPGQEYAIVVLSPASDEYEMWTATMGKKTVRTKNLPDVQNVVVTKQYIGGSLFKSQNGTIWTASQFQDLTFKLYKAQFVSSGTATFYNPDVEPKGDNSTALENNPIEGLPRKLKLNVGGTVGTTEQANIKPGVKISENGSTITGFVENLGGAAIAGTGGVEIVSGGSGYPASGSAVPLFSLTGKGTGATANVTATNGVITGVTITSTTGSGYVRGEIVGLTTSTLTKGEGARIVIKERAAAFDTIYLTGVQGENFTPTRAISFFNGATETNTNATVGTNGSELIDNIHTGNVLRIKQHNHAHHGANNKIQIVDIEPDTTKTTIVGGFGENDTVVSVADTTAFGVFEGITTSRGYALINNEVISYSGITPGTVPAGSLTIDGRALNNSPKTSHASGDSIQPYEVDGVGLMRINKTHDVPSGYYRTENSNVDNFYVEFDRTTPTVRSSGQDLLCFEGDKAFGGNSVGISQNYQFSSFEPAFNVITPGEGTKIEALVRTVSGTSAGGNEVSFQDQGYDPVPLNQVVHYPTPRLVASRANELARLTTLPENKSLAMRVNFTSTNSNVSPVMDIQNATFILGRNKINKPIDDYVADSRSNNITGDPHGAVFVTKVVSLSQPATSLKVIIGANRQEGADFRVFYQLLRVDSANVDQKFIPFPGYDNLIDTDGDGFGDRIIDIDKSSGRADAFVPPNDRTGFSEYQFSVNDIDQFEGFAIKIVLSTNNEATPVRLKDFRAIALA